MKISSRAFVLSVSISSIMALVAACSDDSTDAGASSSSSSSGTAGTSSSGGNTSSSGSNTSSSGGNGGNDSGSEGGDAATDGSGGDGAVTGCTDAGTLATPTSAHAHIDATFVAGGGYNGSAAAFTGSDIPGDSTATNSGFVNIANYAAGGTGTAARSITITSFAAFTSCATIAINGTNVVVRYAEGVPVDRMWACTSGTIQVDSVDGKVANFHLTATCPPTTVNPGTSATGTVTVTATGIASFP